MSGAITADAASFSLAAFFWQVDGLADLHGPFPSRTAAALDAHRQVMGMLAVRIGTRAQALAWRTDIFDRVDEMFDDRNDDLSLPDDPPSCGWHADHLAELR